MSDFELTESEKVIADTAHVYQNLVEGGGFSEVPNDVLLNIAAMGVLWANNVDTGAKLTEFSRVVSDHTKKVIPPSEG